jgi:hypothetical protein
MHNLYPAALLLGSASSVSAPAVKLSQQPVQRMLPDNGCPSRRANSSTASGLLFEAEGTLEV